MITLPEALKQHLAIQIFIQLQTQFYKSYHFFFTWLQASSNRLS